MRARKPRPRGTCGVCGEPRAPRIFDDEELNVLAMGAIEETQEEFGGVLPTGVSVRYRRYGRGGRWEAIGPRTRISTPHGEADAVLHAWWIVTCEVIAARISDDQRERLIEAHAGARRPE